MRRVSGLLAIALLCAGSCAAQRGGGRRGGAGGRGSRAISEDQTISLFTVLLGLKDPQPQNLRAIFDAALRDAQPIRQQIEEDKDALFEAAKSGKNDEEIGKIAVRQATLSSQMMALESRTFAKIYRVLSSDQQAKADSFLYGLAVDLLESGQPPPVPTPPAAPKP
jgi:Spy/CpxP family protein refolding chaperone